MKTHLLHTLWMISIVAAGPLGFIFGALWWGFFPAIVCGGVAIMAAILLPAIVYLVTALAVLYMAYLLVVFLASPWRASPATVEALQDETKQHTTPVEPSMLEANATQVASDDRKHDQEVNPPANPDPTYVSALGLKYGEDEGTQIAKEKEFWRQRHLKAQELPAGTTQQDIDDLKQTLRESLETGNSAALYDSGDEREVIDRSFRKRRQIIEAQEIDDYLRRLSPGPDDGPSPFPD